MAVSYNFLQIYPTKVTRLVDGDKVGFTTEEFGTIAYVNSSEEVVVRALDSLPSHPVTGDIVTVTEMRQRTFSIGVTVGTCPVHFMSIKKAIGLQCAVK
jgi:hypothetical protein